MNSYPNRLAIVAYHANSSYPQFFSQDGRNRVKGYYAFTYFPSPYIDGTLAEYGNHVDTMVVDRMGKTSPLDITLDARENQTIATVKNVSTSTFSGKVYFVMTENGLTESGKTFDWVYRASYPTFDTTGEGGTAVSLAPNASTTITKTYTLNPNWVKSNLHIVVFAQLSTKEVVQGQESSLGAGVPAITVGAPNGGESLLVGSAIDITWVSQNVTGNVKIEYSVDNGASWTSISSSATNSGTYHWTVPNTPSANCLVRVSALSGTPTDTSDQAFTITAGSNYDINGDGATNWSDVAFLSQILSGSQGSVPAADVNADGVVNAADLTLELAKVSGVMP